MQSSGVKLPLGLPDQKDGLPTSPTDRGDETQERFRYQWAMGVCLLAEFLSNERPASALWCEHHDDFLVQLQSDQYVAVQVKTNGAENAVWRLGDAALIEAIGRFCSLEKVHGDKLVGFEFMSNAAPYVPAARTEKLSSLASSPLRLTHCCSQFDRSNDFPSPYKEAFDALRTRLDVSETLLISVLRKIRFRQGPPLRGYEDTLTVKTIPSIPNCKKLALTQHCRLRDCLIGLIEDACRLPSSGADGVIAYLASNGRPEFSLRSKCITLAAAEALVISLQQNEFKFVGGGAGLKLGVGGRAERLQRKMRNAYLGSQFESLKLRMDSAEQRLIERALVDPESTDYILDQLVGAVLVECKDVEALAYDPDDERSLGPLIYKGVIERMTSLAKEHPARVCNEPKDTLIGIAGMLSGECKFAWGVPLQGANDVA